MNKLINTLVCFFLLALNHLNGQLLLSASSDVQLLDNIGQTAKEIKSIPAHKNVQFIEYVALDSYNGNFKVKVYGQTGYINRNNIVYDDAFYMALRISEKQIYLKDASISEKIFSINKVKIREEQIWAKQNGFEHEEYKDMMAQLEKTLPVKPIYKIPKNTTTISQQSPEGFKYQAADRDAGILIKGHAPLNGFDVKIYYCPKEIANGFHESEELYNGYCVFIFSKDGKFFPFQFESMNLPLYSAKGIDFNDDSSEVLNCPFQETR